MNTNRDIDNSGFEQELEAFILTAYAQGVAIEGQWDIDVPLSMAPDWTITIEKRETADEPTYHPTFLND